MTEILHQYPLYKDRAFSKMVRYIKGRHPEQGTLIHPDQSWSGDWETREVVDLVEATTVYEVLERLGKKRLG